MNIITLLHNLRDTIHDDSDTQNWCQSNYGRVHTVHVGIDTDKPPAQDQYPIVHIFPVRKTMGYDQDEQGHVVNITCGVYNADTLDTGKENAVELKGISHVEEFRKLVETAVVGMNISGIFLDMVDVTYETVRIFWRAKNFTSLMLIHKEMTYSVKVD